MNWNRIRKVVAGAGLMAALLVGPAGVFKSTAMGQDRDRDGRRDNRDWRRDRDRNWHHDGDRDRDRNWDRRGQGYVYVPPRGYTYPRTYPYGGDYHGGPGGGFHSGPYGGYYRSGRG